MKIIDRSIELAYKLNQSTPKEFRHAHFATIWRKNKLISIGRNNPISTNGRTMYFARRYNLLKLKAFPFQHSEIDAIGRAWGKYYLDNSYTLVVLRIDKRGFLNNSKPCECCSCIINALGLKTYYSNGEGKICEC